MLWFTAKVVLFIFGFVWLRGTLPRMRYDQFMHLGWKVLIPLNLVWILTITTMRVLRDRGWNTVVVMLVVGVPIIALIALWAVLDLRRTNRIDAELAAEEEAESVRGHTFPIPPMDLVVPPSPRLVSAGVRTPALEAGQSSPDERPLDG
jgi:NADH-quinone oxidoreductase subunit H